MPVFLTVRAHMWSVRAGRGLALEQWSGVWTFLRTEMASAWEDRVLPYGTGRHTRELQESLTDSQVEPTMLNTYSQTSGDHVARHTDEGRDHAPGGSLAVTMNIGPLSGV